MENLSSSLPKKIHNGGSGNGFTGKTAYDDVFGGPPKFGMPTFSPRVEDYSEIFGGFHASRASSVPVLDLPPVADAEVLFDFRSSMFDYSEVFGGFDGLDFAVSYEELFFDQSKGGDESSEEAWTSAGTESLSEETYPFADSKENQSLSNEDCQSFEGGRQFNISYHRANQRSQDDMSNGTHVTHIHDIPGVTFVVDEITPSKKTEYEYPPVINDINQSVDFSGGEVEGKHLRKTILHSLNSSAGSRTFEKDFRPQRTYSQYDSHSNEMFVGISEISLRTEPSHLPPPSRPPPIIDARKGDSKELDFNPVVTGNYAFEGTEGDSSPPFFDVEVDASSSAAASAAAMKEAMEKAEAKLKSAKELMERKKEGLQKVRTREENGKKLTVSHRNEESQRKVTKVGEPGEAEISIEVQQKENKTEVKEAMKHKGREQKLKDANRRMENENRLAEVREREENEKRLKEMFEREEYERRLKEALERAENEKMLGEALERAENEKRLKQVLEKEENEKRLKEQVETEKKQKQAREREENEKKLKEALEREKNEKRSKEKLEREEKEKKQKEACEREENEKKRNEALAREENEKRLKEALEREENARKQKMADERIENVRRMKEVLEREEVEKRLKEANQRLKEAHEREKYEKKMKEVVEQKEIDERSRQAGAWEKNENRLEDVGERGQRGLHKADEDLPRDENEEKLKQTQGTQAHIVGEKLNASDEACKMGKNKNLRATQVVCKHKEHNVELEATQELLADEENEEMRTKSKDGDYEVEAVEKANVLVGDRFKASGMAQDDLQREEIQERIKDAIKSQLLSENVKRSDEAVIDIEQTCVENIEVPQKASESDPKNTVKKVTYEWEKGGKNTKRAQMASDQEGSKEKLISTQGINEGFVNGKKMESVQSTISEGRGNTKKTAQQVTTSRSLERKEQNVNVTFTSEEGEKEERAKRERELEKDRLRKIEEEKEREREREKDRMAVERATFDARERAYSEVRERAERAAVERATAEARQRAMTEARERLEKVCAEAREKSLAGKVSAEARLRAERAAVERATAEARERAFEKAMAEKASFEARERLERSASSSGLRYPYSVYGASYNTEKSEGVEGESAQRCKARSERHRRTAERAAKALAERNMRDLQAQREQAERNRISETLDADVKRWSSGKEGNLRALLSTLQYILGPDCGWQPIPLTEVITAAAVKKAYRKATLCVHPDKLQQRGASIPQKYVCEKVFDLLKEAWNKFNSEER